MGERGFMVGHRHENNLRPFGMLRSLLRAALYRGTGIPVEFPRSLAAKWLDLTSLRRMLHQQRINVVIDVGANEGQFATKLRRLSFAGRIVSFEPDPRSYARLVACHGGDAAWRGYPVALGNADTEAEFNIAVESLLSSFLTPIHSSNVSERVRIPVRRLDGLLSELLEEIAAPRVFLKTDTQGFDLDVLRGSSGCLDRIIGIVAELSVIPIYEQSPPFEEAIRTYREAGFDLVDLSLVNRTIDGRVLEFDGLFIRRSIVAS